MKSFIALAVLALFAPVSMARDFDFDLNHSPATAISGPLHLHTNDTIRFVVDENPSTGYRWIYHSNIVRGIEEEEAVFSVELDEHRVVPTTSAVNGIATPLSGATGTRVIQLRAEQAGSDVFEIVYARSWDIAEGETLAENGDAGHHVLAIQVTDQ